MTDEEAARATKARRTGRVGLWLRVGMDLYELLCCMPTETSGAAVYFQGRRFVGKGYHKAGLFNPLFWKETHAGV
jgi:hypothetical protein